MRFIANDICRCCDTRCPVRHECLRYLLRDNGGERTPVAASLMNAAGDTCNSLIHVERGVYVSWKGGPCPVDPDTRVRVLFSDRDEKNATRGSAKDFDWNAQDVSVRIVAFALEKL